MEHYVWVEKYRPKKIQDCVLPDNLKKIFQDFVDTKEFPSLLLSGGAGVGKTTVAKALCEEIGIDYLVINGSDDRGIAVIQNTVKSFATSISLSGGRKTIIIDEADNLTADAQKALRGVIEDVSSNCGFIFTCNFKNRIIEPIHSRCKTINFNISSKDNNLALKFFKTVKNILDIENVSYDDQVVASIVKKYFPDNRKTLNELQGFSASGSIDKSVLSLLEIDIKKVITLLKDKDYTEIRKWVANNVDIDAPSLFRKFYETAYEYVKPSSIPQLVIHLNNYQYKHAFVADPEINLMAFFTECMVDLEYK